MNPNWKPLEEKLGPNRCVGFMYMGRVNGVHQYKHGITRTYLYLDDRGSCYVWNQPSGFVNADFATELATFEADLRGCDAALEPSSDYHYIARKERCLTTLGSQTLRTTIAHNGGILHPGPV